LRAGLFSPVSRQPRRHSDHADLQAAIDHGVTVAEVTYCNSISVSEHVVMMILSLVRNYIPSYQWGFYGGNSLRKTMPRRTKLCYGCRRGTIFLHGARHQPHDRQHEALDPEGPA
jgi:lactate dehydrogenase-like 2-hydroxyacid dehydrogenase